MTENEAIDKLNNLHYKIVHTSFCNKVYESEIEALCMAKDCLKEIQQYRAIGTIEELKAMKQWKTDVMEGFCKYDASSFEEIVAYARANAIDNFAAALRLKCLDSVYKEVGLHTILEIAEQLKAGVQV